MASDLFKGPVICQIDVFIKSLIYFMDRVPAKSYVGNVFWIFVQMDLYGLLISSIVFTLSAFLCEASKATRGALPAYIACLATIMCC